MLTKYKTLAFGRSYGVELEADPNLDAVTVLGLLHRATDRQVRYRASHGKTSDNSFWHLKTDSSCGNDLNEHGWEVVSFKASRFSDLKEIGRVADALRIGGLKTNSHCGLHIHIDISDFNQEQVGVLIARWIKIERILQHSLPFHRVFNAHCRFFCHSDMELVKKLQDTSFWKKVGLNASQIWTCFSPTDYRLSNNVQRQKAMNLVNYAASKHYGRLNYVAGVDRRTVEFRFPEGTLEGRQIINWVRFLLLFVEAAKNQKMPENLRDVNNFDDFWLYFGLSHPDEFYIFSKSIYDVKKWFYERILAWSDSLAWSNSARRKLDQMCNFDRRNRK